MSDRIAVFAAGRVEQVGTPVEVYEHPASEFVAGFVGVSNLLERGGRRFTVRPEKIRILGAEQHPPPGDESEPGVVRDVVYVGAVTRYVVELDGGGTLTVVVQNVDGFSGRTADEQGRRVVLAWRTENTFTIASDKEVAE
jgi:putative spermidine/putrescine transport system ATP-binding protein